MREVWLKSNSRALLMSILPVALVETFALLVAVLGGFVFDNPVLMWCGGLVWVVSSIVLVGLVLQWSQPRIARDGEYVLLFVRGGLPVRVPLNLVEGFLLGQGPTMLAGPSHELETANLVIKLADKAEEFQKVEVKSTIASWCNSYVTIRGTWCEPLSVEIVNRLNMRLYEAKRPQPAGVV